MEPKQAGKRIVSKGAYVQAQARRLTLAVSALFLLHLTGLFILLAVVGVLWGFLWNRVTAIALAPCFAVAAYVSSLGLRFSLAAACRINPGVPLTRVKTADLPTPDTLVRASSEPAHLQETVLLRAAKEGLATPPEQLVRAVSETEQD